MDVPCSLTQFREWLRDNSFYLHDRGLVYGLILGVDDACRSSRLELVVRRTREDMERIGNASRKQSRSRGRRLMLAGNQTTGLCGLCGLCGLSPHCGPHGVVIDVGKPGERGIPGNITLLGWAELLRLSPIVQFPLKTRKP